MNTEKPTFRSRALMRGTDTSLAGAIVTLMYIYELCPAEAIPPLQVLIGILLLYFRNVTEQPTTQQEINNEEPTPPPPDL